MVTRFIRFSLFTQVRCKFWTRVQRNIARYREENRISLQKELYTGIFIPNVAMNQCHEYDETTTLVCYTFVECFRRNLSTP